MFAFKKNIFYAYLYFILSVRCLTVCLLCCLLISLQTVSTLICFRTIWHPWRMFFFFFCCCCLSLLFLKLAIMLSIQLLWSEPTSIHCVKHWYQSVLHIPIFHKGDIKLDSVARLLPIICPMVTRLSINLIASLSLYICVLRVMRSRHF